MMPFEKGKVPKNAWVAGQSGNPAGRPKNALSVQTKAAKEIVSVLEDVMTSKNGVQEWRAFCTQQWRKDPLPLLRWYDKFIPRESMQVTASKGGALARYSVDQLLDIAGLTDEQEAIDISAEVECESDDNK